MTIRRVSLAILCSSSLCLCPGLRAATHASAKPAVQQAPAPAASTNKLDPAKEAHIRELLEVTGAGKLGDQLLKAMLQQFRTSFTRSLPDNARAQAFINAFIDRFQKKFNPQELVEQVIPIYDKYFTDEDLTALIAFYRSPVGQRAIKVLPLVVQEGQEKGAKLGERLARETMLELQPDFPEFFPKSDGSPQN